MLSLFLAILIVQGESPKAWITLSNLPGWEGYGAILPSGWIDPERFRRTSDPGTELPPASAALASPSAPAAVGTDPHGFVGWLNGQRAARGLPAVGHDPGLSGWAAFNSSHGFGHSVMGPARRQNAGWGDASYVWPAWLASPAHAAALFDPSLTRVGIAVVNGVWTMNGD